MFLLTFFIPLAWLIAALEVGMQHCSISGALCSTVGEKERGGEEIVLLEWMKQTATKVVFSFEKG